MTASNHPDTPPALRARFPYLADIAYLNAAGAAPSSTDVRDAAERFHSEIKLKGLDSRLEWRAKIEAVRARLAAYLNAQPDAVGFHGSCTEAMNLLAVSIAQPEQFLVVADPKDHAAVWAPWAGAASRGVRLQFNEVQRGAPREVGLMAAATKFGAQAIAISHVDWQSGARVDLQSLSAFCRARGIFLIVDGSQAAGAIDVDATLADAYLGSTFKWLLAGFGLGYMVLSPALSERLVPGVRGYRNEPPSRDLRYGHLNLGGIYELDAALGLLESAVDLGLADQPSKLAVLLRQRVLDDDRSVITPAASAGIVAISCDDSVRVAEELRMHGVSVQAQPGALRASAHIYNTVADIERCVRALHVVDPVQSGRKASHDPR